MKKIFLSITALFSAAVFVSGQNTAPFWSLAGNSNVETSSKFGTTNNRSIRFYTNNVQRMIINSAEGYIGIGTATPATMLHVKKDLEALRIEGNTPYLSFFNNAGVYKGFVWQGPGDNISLGTALGNTTGHVQLYNNGVLNLSVTNTGRVGIGTPNPQSKLEIKSSATEGNNNTDLLKLTGRNPLLSFFDENSNFYGYIKSWTYGPYAPFTNGMLIGSAPGYPIYLSTNYGPTMIIASNDNVGIGTTTPAYKLSVNGTIQSKELRIETGWADYVFEADYKLPPLHEVENFINIHKHLPGVTAGREIETEGLEVGKVSAQMIKKIEELTLYAIMQEKSINMLKEQNAKLEAKINSAAKKGGK